MIQRADFSNWCAEKGKNRIVGIEREGFESTDEYERHIIQQITNRLV